MRESSGGAAQIWEVRAFSRRSHACLTRSWDGAALRRYGFTIVACVIVGVLAMVMTGAASHEEDPPPVQLNDRPPDATPRKPARTRRMTTDGARA
jgi:hypothetical protein